MDKPKFRLFAGPNGSGKTYVFKQFKKAGIIHTEMYINADKIEAALRVSHTFSFNAYRVKVSDNEFKQYVLQSGLYNSKMKEGNFTDQLSVRSGKLYINAGVRINSYHASFIASFLAEKLLATGQSFAFETVMSHPSKINLLIAAKEAGYKTYLYFIFTDSLTTNVTRVKLRALQGEHDVSEETIKSRAPRTFALLPKAFALADTAYVIDNSFEAVAIAQKESAKIVVAKSIPDIIGEAIANIR